MSATEVSHAAQCGWFPTCEVFPSRSPVCQETAGKHREALSTNVQAGTLGDVEDTQHNQHHQSPTSAHVQPIVMRRFSRAAITGGIGLSWYSGRFDVAAVVVIVRSVSAHLELSNALMRHRS